MNPALDEPSRCLGADDDVGALVAVIGKAAAGIVGDASSGVEVDVGSDPAVHCRPAIERQGKPGPEILGQRRRPLARDRRRYADGGERDQGGKARVAATTGAAARTVAPVIKGPRRLDRRGAIGPWKHIRPGF